MEDSLNLERLLAAQEPIYQQVLHELDIGVKTADRIWFFFRKSRVSAAVTWPDVMRFPVARRRAPIWFIR